MKNRSLFCLIACVLLLSSSIPCIAVESEANDLDFEYKVLTDELYKEVVDEYEADGIHFGYCVEFPPMVVKSQNEWEECLNKFNPYNPNEEFDVFAFAYQLDKSFFDEKAIICLCGSGNGATKYEVTAVTINNGKVVVEYNYDRGDILSEVSTVIIIEVNKSDIGDRQVITLANEVDPNEQQEYKLGDLSKDGYCGQKDYVWLKRYCNGNMLLSKEQLELADINKDGSIDKKDYVLIKRAVFGTYVIE